MSEAEPRKLASSPNSMALLLCYCPDCSRQRNALVVVKRSRPEASGICPICGWTWRPLASVGEDK